MKVSLLYRITAAAVFVQIALGGLLTFDFIDSGVHRAFGAIVFILAIVALVVVARLKPRPKQLMGLTVGVVALMVVQVLLGFSTLDSGDQSVAWVHLVVAMAIYGRAVAGTFMAVDIDVTARAAQTPSIGG